MKNNLGILAGVVYFVGFLSVQVHLLRFGILEISPLQAYYLIVGLWFLLCISPAIAIVGVAEYFLKPCDSKRGRLIVLAVASAVLGGMIVSTIRFSLSGLILNYNAYPYPWWY